MPVEMPSSHAEAETGLSASRVVALFAGPALSAVVFILPPPPDMPPEAWRLVALVVWMVVWWLSEAVPLAVTALLPIIILPLFGITGIQSVTSEYGHPLIFLFLGGFMLAMAVQRAGLHRRLALHVVAYTGRGPRLIILGFMIATGFLSMWITNTAATMMMFTVGLPVIELVAKRHGDGGAKRNFGVALMLGIAYSASIGGLGTLIGTPPNAILASVLAGEYDIEIGFFEWMLFGVPVVIVMLPVAWFVLTFVQFPPGAVDTAEAREAIRRELAALGPMRRDEWIVGIVFALAAAGWILRGPLSSVTGLPISDTTVALVAALAMFAIPVDRSRGRFALDWEAARSLPWHVLLLFGGGLALAEGFRETGLAVWIGDAVGSIEISTLLLVALLVTVMVLLTEITSNIASAANASADPRRHGGWLRPRPLAAHRADHAGSVHGLHDAGRHGAQRHRHVA